MEKIRLRMNNNKIIRMFLLVFVALFFFSGVLRVEEASGSNKKVKWVKSKTGVNSLMTFAGDRDAMIREYKKETSKYHKIKQAVSEEHLEVGETTDDISKKYGDPVVVVSESGDDVLRWVYKPGEDSFFKGEKIYLFFDQAGRLMDWQVISKE
jgi:hypothetical protein